MFWIKKGFAFCDLHTHVFEVHLKKFLLNQYKVHTSSRVGLISWSHESQVPAAHLWCPGGLVCCIQFASQLPHSAPVTVGLGHISWRILPSIFKFDKRSVYSNSITNNPIATNICTCHDSCAVVACANVCNNQYIRIWMRMKWNCHHIWISKEKLFVKWVPRHLMIVIIDN